MVRKSSLILVACFVLILEIAVAQDAREVLRTVAENTGADDLQSIQYTGTGWYGQYGQSFAPGENFPRTDVLTYTRTIDYQSGSSREDFTRRQGDPPPRGGGFPFLGEQRIVSLVSGAYAWSMQAENVNPQPAIAEIRQLEIWTTPHGFLKAAMEADPTAISRIEVDDRLADPVRNMIVVSFTALGKYRVNGHINEENLVEAVQAWVPDPVLGDTLWEVRYNDYRDYGSVKFPTVMHYHRGNRFLDFGHDVLEVTVSDVQPNVRGAELDVPATVRQATVRPVQVASQRLADGVWLIAGGSHNSVAVEFNDFVAVVEAPLNEARSLAVIDEVTRLVPNKPLRYVVNTHHHFDHSGGLRTYVAHGATVITHQGNKEFYENVVLYPAPRTLQPDRLSLVPPRTALLSPPVVEPVHYRYALSDGTQTIELHPVLNLRHTGTMLIAYLPRDRMLINADLYTPSADGATQVPPAFVPGVVTLDDNIRRLKLDVVQHVPIHGQPGSHQQFLTVVRNASTS